MTETDGNEQPNARSGPSNRLGRDQWVMAALYALGESGTDAISVEPLAKSLGVTKGSFYWHFEDRRALHEAVLSRWEDIATAQIIEQVESSAVSDARQRLRRLFEIVFGGGSTGDGIESAMRAWARIDTDVAAAAVRVDQRRLNYVSSLLREIGLPRALADQRARILYRTLVGEFVWRSSGGPRITETEIDDLADLLTTPRLSRGR